MDELAGLRHKVRGAGNLERFDYSASTYPYMAAMAEAGCVRGELDRAVAALGAGKSTRDTARRQDLAKQALAVRTRLARLWEKMVALQVAVADTPGGLGTLANLEQHNRKQLQFLDAHDAAIESGLGQPLPAAIALSKVYAGPARVMVPTVRTLASKGEVLTLKVMLLDARPMRGATLYWRPLGGGAFHEVEVKPVARAVHTVSMPPLEGDIEYYIRAVTADGRNWRGRPRRRRSTRACWRASRRRAARILG